MTRMVLLLATLAGVGTGDEPLTLTPCGRLSHPAIVEASGLVASRKYPGIFWTHNDSGNAPRLFAVKADGTLVREFSVGVPNVDWEDITADDKGRLFIGDIGNNGGRLPLRAVYQLDEPDPTARRADDARPLRVSTASYYQFASKDERFDAEALVVDGDNYLIVAKTFDGGDAQVYAVPRARPAPLLRPAVPRRVGTLPGFIAPVTGGSLSPDGLLAVVSYKLLGVFNRDATGQWRKLVILEFKGGDGVEAVAWDGRDLLLAGEGRGLYRVAEARWRRGIMPAGTPIRRAGAHGG